MSKRVISYLRSKGSLQELALTSADKPKVEKDLIEEWQKTCNTISLGTHEPVASILSIAHDFISIHAQYNNANQEIAEIFSGDGLYCESESAKKGLLIMNVGSTATNSDLRDSASGVTSCFGLPIQWPDHELFGAICVLNKPASALRQPYQSILANLRASFERDLSLLYDQRQIHQTSETDFPTSIHSRKRIEEILKHEFESAKRYSKPLSVTILAFNSLKQSNDTNSYEMVYEIVKVFMDSISSRIRETDYFGRWDDDEFVLICPYTSLTETEHLLARIKPTIMQEMTAVPDFTNFHYGVSQYMQNDMSYLAIVKRAVGKMYHQKADTNTPPIT